MPSTITESEFASLGLPQQIVTIVERLGFVTPTPIQKESIPLGLAGRDVLGIAQTGTGKTLAFGLPIVSALKERRGMAIVVVPTRELAIQVDETLRKVCTALQIKTAVLIGGAPMYRQVQQIKGGAHIIIATPGRLTDHLKQGTLRLDQVRIAVLDEADRMLDMGFLPDIRRIMERIPKDRQTMLYSATMPNEIASLTREFMRDPIRVEIAKAGTATELVEQSLLVVEMEDKPDTLYRLLTEAVGTVLVFARTRHGARKIAKMVRSFGLSAAELHSDRTLAQRREALDGFKAGNYRVLVATDIAARGIDVKRIELVVNYDVPDNPEDYVHRIGRTGRAGETGRAVTVATPQQSGQVYDIERVIGREIPVAPESPLRLEPRSSGRGGGGRGGSGRGGGRPQRGPRPSQPREPREPRPERPTQAGPAAPGAPNVSQERPISTRARNEALRNEAARNDAPRPDGDRRNVQWPDDRGPRTDNSRFAPGANPAPVSHPKVGKPQHPGTPAAPTGPRRPVVAPAAKKKRLPEGPHPFDKFMKSPKRRG